MKKALLALAIIGSSTSAFAQTDGNEVHAAAELRAAQNRERNAGVLDSQAEARARRNTYDRVNATQIHEAAEQRAGANREKNASLLDAQARARRNTNDHIRAAVEAKAHENHASGSAAH